MLFGILTIAFFFLVFPQIYFYSKKEELRLQLQCTAKKDFFKKISSTISEYISLGSFLPDFSFFVLFSCSSSCLLEPRSKQKHFSCFWFQCSVKKLFFFKGFVAEGLQFVVGWEFTFHDFLVKFFCFVCSCCVFRGGVQK